MEPSGYPCRHVSLANPRGNDETNLPMLLRRLADLLVELDIHQEDVLDVTISSQITERGPWWSATVYWSPDTMDGKSDHPTPAGGEGTPEPDGRTFNPA